MRTFYFFHRVALICNVCFLLAFGIQVFDWMEQEQLRSTVVIVGYVMGLAFNPLLNLFGLIFRFARRRMLSETPRWLLVTNALFLVPQLLFILYLNGPQPA